MTEILLRLTIALGFGLLAALACSRTSARTRVLVLRATLVCSLASAIFSLASVRVGVPIGPVQKVEPVVLTEYVLEPGPVEQAPVEPKRETPIWVYGWVGGSLVLVASFGLSMARLARIRRGSTGLNPGHARQILVDAGVHRPVLMARSTDLATALTYGFRRHVLLVPAAFLEWADKQQRAVLFHEAAHIRRFDCAWHWLALAFRALFWFHPLAWILAWAHREESELAADEFAIASGVPALDYADALLAVARIPSHRGLVRSQGAITMSKQRLSRRVQAALRPQRGFSTLGTLALAFFVVSAGAFTGVAEVVPSGQNPVVQAGDAKPLPPQQPTSAKEPLQEVPIQDVIKVQNAQALEKQKLLRVKDESLTLRDLNARKLDTYRFTMGDRIETKAQRLARLKAEEAELLARKGALLAERDSEVIRMEAKVARLRKEVKDLERKRLEANVHGLTVRGAQFTFAPTATPAEVFEVPTGAGIGPATAPAEIGVGLLQPVPSGAVPPKGADVTVLPPSQLAPPAGSTSIITAPTPDLPAATGSLGGTSRAVVGVLERSVTLATAPRPSQAQIAKPKPATSPKAKAKPKVTTKKKR
ncbi:MAG: M56 family metallopeptidase [Fimbriimonas sp.]